jgi:hypothetical protein
MEELTEVITAAEFHPIQCNQFMYSSSKGTIKLADMRERALCDQHAKCESLPLMPELGLTGSIRGGRGPSSEIILFRNHFVHLRREILQGRQIHLIARLSYAQDLGCRHGEQTSQDDQYPRTSPSEVVRFVRE